MELFKYPNPDTKMYRERSTTFKNLQSHHPEMRRTFAKAKRLAELGEPVVILGPTGTGKAHVAIAMAGASPYKGKAFVEANGGSAPESLYESEWLGSEKNCATGMPEAKLGLFRQAAGGILMLDEAETIPRLKQHIFLHPFNGGRVRPVGASRDLIVDFCAYVLANEDLAEMVAKGLFRPDLWMRFSTHVLYLMALCERPDDILPTFYERYVKECKRLGTKVEDLPDDLSAMMEAFRWPGNSREVAQVAKDAAALGLRPAVEDKCLPKGPAVLRARGNGVPSALGPRPRPCSDDWRDVLALHVWGVHHRLGCEVQATMEAVKLSRAAVYRCLSRARELLG